MCSLSDFFSSRFWCSCVFGVTDDMFVYSYASIAWAVFCTHEFILSQCLSVKFIGVQQRERQHKERRIERESAREKEGVCETVFSLINCVPSDLAHNQTEKQENKKSLCLRDCARLLWNSTEIQIYKNIIFYERSN